MSSQEITALWEEYYPKVYGYFYRRIETKEDVEDLTSITMTAFINVITDAQKSSRLVSKHGYLWKIANNQLCNFIRDKVKKPLTVGLNDNLSSIEDSFEQIVSDRYRSKMEDLHKCFQEKLKGDDYRLVCELIIEDKKSDQVAQMFNLTSSNVRQRCSRALKKLRESCQKIYDICYH
jgi:RNA polymerase sigma factor (sigma-70 family)